MPVVLSVEVVSVLPGLFDQDAGELVVGVVVCLGVVFLLALLEVCSHFELEVNVGEDGPWRIIRVL